jgi:hypothetical protein
MAMKKLLFVLVALLVVALTVPAMAEQFTSRSYDPYKASVNVEKCYDVNYDLDKYVNIYVNTFVTDSYFTFTCKRLDPYGRASASVVKNQINEGNSFELVALCGFTDYIYNSFGNAYRGIGQANQSAGFMNNQANVVNAAVVGKADPLCTAEVVEVQFNSGVKNNADPILSCFSDTIDLSFNGFCGVGQANQSAGFANNQNNVVNVAFATNPALIATSDVILEQVNVNNSICLLGVSSNCTVTNSFNGFTGVGQVNQSSGSLNNQANIVSFAGSR